SIMEHMHSERRQSFGRREEHEHRLRRYRLLIARASKAAANIKHELALSIECELCAPEEFPRFNFGAKPVCQFLESRPIHTNVARSRFGIELIECHRLFLLDSHKILHSDSWILTAQEHTILTVLREHKRRRRICSRPRFLSRVARIVRKGGCVMIELYDLCVA